MDNQENNIEIIEDKKTNKLWIWIIIVFLILIILGLVGYILYDKGIIFKQSESNTSEIDNSNDAGNKKTNNNEKINVLEKTKPFIKAAMYSDSMGNGIAEQFVKGYSKLTKNDKVMIVYNSLIRVKNESKIVTEVPTKYKNDESYWKESTITSLLIESFKKEYKEFFKEELNITDVKLENTGCPMLYKIDEELGYLYFSDQCGGTMNPIYLYKTYKTDEDDNYYYVYQYVGLEEYSDSGLKEYKKVKANQMVNVSSFEGNEDKFEKVVWKFDKNFKFISTENIG